MKVKYFCEVKAENVTSITVPQNVLEESLRAEGK